MFTNAKREPEAFNPSFHWISHRKSPSALVHPVKSAPSLSPAFSFTSFRLPGEKFEQTNGLNTEKEHPINTGARPV